MKAPQKDALVLLDRLRKMIPPLLETFHKGQAGRVGVFGGCQHYTGAPYYSSISSMLFGCDQSHIVCEKKAANVIKSYSPDLIVHPFLLEKATAGPQDNIDKILDLVKPIMKRLHVIVIGPGLGRDEWMLATMERIITYARQQNMPMVIDADGLFLIQQKPELVSGYHNVVLTPNVIEFKRLCDRLNVSLEEEDPCAVLARKMNVVIIRKGLHDTISDGDTTFTCTLRGGLKRCGGQGDVMTGILAAFLAWRRMYLDDEWKTEGEMGPRECLLLAAFGACVSTRLCSRFAFEEKKRATLATDLVSHVGRAYETVASGAVDKEFE
ncbi:hypothetical protein SJAG_03669 [Schizosaccharomyces japonicus yFS275]|uniref:ATP-dependent (S)-NAD(P)H-hydrate dehydratase n=1 Tax=Schizosaccharomyces japonicus (strain yFS275 / FY16936) TaxID=402676 RepID=B6K4V5_SCHJY|nr:hypothetical protein SJAG_03669 [Schizosaccharomyces japonicus yFS275]EEB08512.1 hypothetical protein SJAG_03669 [Schizosaccharomyces japonicus yFS275]